MTTLNQPAPGKGGNAFRLHAGSASAAVPEQQPWVWSAVRRMRKFLKIGIAVAIANLLSFWTAYSLLVTAWPHIGLPQLLGFSPPPAVSYWLASCMWVFVVLGAPTSVILDGTGGDHFILLLMLSSILNSIIWGACLGLPIYAITRRFRSRVAQQIA